MRRFIAANAALAILALGHGNASSFPLGLSAVGGIGAGYYAMEELNRHIGIASQERHVAIDGITRGVNFRVEGRAWIMDQFALTGGYEHLWAATDAEGSSSSLSYRAPTDVFTVGAIVVVLRIENSINLCAGVNGCFAKSVYGTNELVERRLSEFKGDNRGYEVFGEIHTNVFNPIEVGFQLGYRGLTIDDYKDKYGRRAFFEPGTKMEIDYSGAFFYLTTAIRI